MEIEVQEIADLVGVQLGRQDVHPEHHFVEDLGAESIDLVNLMVTIEDRYQIKIDEEQASRLTTVADVCDFLRRHE